MAFTFSIVGRTVAGDKTIIYGNYTNTAGSTGGEIITGLVAVENFQLTGRGTAVNTGDPVFNENALPTDGTITIVTDATTNGNWFAIGY